MGTRTTKAVASVRLLPRCNKTKIANYTGIDWTVRMEWSECEITTQKSRQYCWLNGTDNFITCVIANAALNYGMGDTLCASVIKIVINISEKFRHVIKSCSTVKINFQDTLFCVKWHDPARKNGGESARDLNKLILRTELSHKRVVRTDSEICVWFNSDISKLFSENRNIFIQVTWERDWIVFSRKAKQFNREVKNLS